MSERYDHKKIEKKWQQVWADAGVFKATEDADKPKTFVLDMFPYPSGEGLHVGHPKGYVATDIYSRFKRMNGHNVLHPMGWDAFGLPAENYALKNKVHPRVAVEKNIANFKEQLAHLGFDYDWSREINTTDPAYYKWTQWIFLQLFKKGLAYQSNEPINWCPSCMTGLANEDLDGDVCERCGTKVEKKALPQWVLKITDYADRMLKDLDLLQWPEHIKVAQRNWIGRSEGAEIEFAVSGGLTSEQKVTVFTTRPDTLFGATYLVLAPEHVLIESLAQKATNKDEIVAYVVATKNKTELDRTKDTKDKTGVELKGIKAINPANQEEIPVFVADYVLGGYGTGAIMAVPAHDERDFAFAQKFGIRIVPVITPFSVGDSETISDKSHMLINDMYTGPGILTNSGKFDGMESEEAKKKITEFVEGKLTKTYKLKDWVFSRQRYWGEPIPIIHCPTDGAVAVPEDQLPVLLPEVKAYEPSGTGESPLATIKEFVDTKCPQCGGAARRETNTMPQWAGSSWYYLRFMDPHNDMALVSPEKEKYWAPVDVYVGGDHAVRHLIYARFWHKFLYDIGVVSTVEPFARLEFLGFILAEDGKKMSKRAGNVINPDDIVAQFGADSFRVYEMFMGPFENTVAWSTQNMVGARRFVERIWKLSQKPLTEDAATSELEVMLHKTIKKVSEDIEGFKFNTAISHMMICLNTMEAAPALQKGQWGAFVRLLAPFAPHIAEELWQQLGGGGLVAQAQWPAYDPSKITASVVIVAVQINGKVRGSVELAADAEEAEALLAARANPAVAKWLTSFDETQGKEGQSKVVYVPGKIINFVITQG